MRILLKFRRILQDSWSQFINFGRFFGSIMVAAGKTPMLPEASAKVFRPQINTDWHRLRAKALNESQGNHWDRFTSVYQPERVNLDTSRYYSLNMEDYSKYIIHSILWIVFLCRVNPIFT